MEEKERRKGAQPRYQREPRSDSRKQRPRKSYSIGEVLCTVVLIAGVLSMLWGYAVMYQIGYSKGAEYTEKVLLHG